MCNHEPPCNEWLPIETAPKGKRILVCVAIEKHRLVIAYKNDFGLFLDEQMRPMQYPPFWWMPLPDKTEGRSELC